MKPLSESLRPSLILAASMAVTCLASGPAGATTTYVYGSSLAQSCYDAAENRRLNPDTMTVCNRALEEGTLDPVDRAATLVNRGVLFLIDNRFSDARRDFDEALVFNPGEAEAWLNKAIISVKTEQGASALGAVNRALALNTRRPELAYFVRGIANEDSGNVKAAYSDLVRARNLAPDWNEPAIELKRYKVR